MNLLYDHQMFAMQKFGGITRIFVELMRELSRLPDLRIHWFRGLHRDDNDTKDFEPRLASYWAGRESSASLDGLAPREANRRAFAEFVRSRPVPIDVYHPTYYDDALTELPRARKLVVTVFDMILERHLSGIDRFREAREGKRRLIERADLIFVSSESTARDLRELFPGSASKIRFTPWASRLGELASAPLPAVLEGPPFFLYVGPRSKYKNFEVLVRAFAAAPRLRREFRVLCAGGPGDFAGPELEAMTSLRVRDRFVHVDAQDPVLKALYEKAVGLVYTSRYEGFGLPPLEAMQCGCPVICSPTSSLPEVVGDASLSFDPDSHGELAARMLQLADNGTVRRACVERGRVRAGLFSWERTARATLDGYREVCGASDPDGARPLPEAER